MRPDAPLADSLRTPRASLYHPSPSLSTPAGKGPPCMNRQSCCLRPGAGTRGCLGVGAGACVQLRYTPWVPLGLGTRAPQLLGQPGEWEGGLTCPLHKCAHSKKARERSREGRVLSLVAETLSLSYTVGSPQVTRVATGARGAAEMAQDQALGSRCARGPGLLPHRGTPLPIPGRPRAPGHTAGPQWERGSCHRHCSRGQGQGKAEKDREDCRKAQVVGSGFAERGECREQEEQLGPRPRHVQSRG